MQDRKSTSAIAVAAGLMSMVLVISSSMVSASVVNLGDPAYFERANTIGDNTKWNVTYYPDATIDNVAVYADAQEAQDYASAYADAAVDQYKDQVSVWPFTHVDADGILRIEVDGSALSAEGTPEDSRIVLRFKVDETIADMGFSYPNKSALYKSIIGHEWHHILQQTIDANMGGAGGIFEGGADLAGILLAPENAHQPNSSLYKALWQLYPDHPERSMGDMVHDFSLPLAYISAGEGGSQISILKSIYDETETIGVPAWTDTPSIIDAVLTERSFTEAYTAFALDLVRRENFTWEGRDWSIHLNETHREATLTVPDEVASQGNGWSLHYFGLPLAGDVTVRVDSAKQDSFVSTLLTKDGGSWVADPVGLDGRYYPAATYEDALVVVVHSSVETGGVGFTVNTTDSDTIEPQPTMLINGGASSTTSRDVTLDLTCTDEGLGVKEVRYRNEAESWGSISWETFQSQKSWTLSSGSGDKTVFYQCKDHADNIDEASDSITYMGI